MKVSSSKEKILKKVREALSNPVPLPFPKSEGSNSVFQPPTEDLEILFAEEFTKLMGKFAFCINEEDAKDQIQKLITGRKWKDVYCIEGKFSELLQGNDFIKMNTSSLAECDAAITSCSYLIARTGSIVMSSGKNSGRAVSVYAPVHICIAYLDQLVFDTRDALKDLKSKYGNTFPSYITFVAGPSRTMNIENTMLIGAHGPKEVYLFLIDKPL